MQFLANKSVFILVTSILFGAPAAAVVFYVLNSYEIENHEEGTQTNTSSELNPRLIYVEPNHWIKFHKPWSLAWRRQQHAGMAYDSKRGNLLIFGSDTHNTNWDNSIHEFNPLREKWTTSYIPSDKVNYQTNENNIAIAWDGAIKPRAMHSFDNVIYDPTTDVLFVATIPMHYSVPQDDKQTKHAMWMYDLNTKAWKIFNNNGKPMPNFLAGATSYDPDRDAIVAYKGGIWELGPERREWIRASGEKHHGIHYNMEYDHKNKQFVVFGNNNLTNIVWSYKPGENIGDKGQWYKHEPKGNIPPKDEHFPVAFDPTNDVFLLVPDNNNNFIGSTTQKSQPVTSSSTYMYDLETEEFIKLPDADLPPLGMNYMMAYDPQHEVFLLVTGKWQEPPIVWALKLVPEMLR